jgi:hypothetical protein
MTQVGGAVTPESKQIDAEDADVVEDKAVKRAASKSRKRA